MDWENDPEMRQLREEFRASFAARARLLEDLLRALDAAPASASAGPAGSEVPELVRAGILRLAHTLAGAAGSYGFRELGEEATALEDLLLAENPGPAREAIAGLGRKVLELLRAS